MDLKYICGLKTIFMDLKYMYGLKNINIVYKKIVV